MKYKTILLENPEAVTIHDGVRPPYAADLIGLSYYLGKGGGLHLRAQVKSAGFGIELVEKSNVCSNF